MFTLGDGMLRAMGAAGPAKANLWEDSGPAGELVDRLAEGEPEGDAAVMDVAALEIVEERYPTMLGLMAERLAAGEEPDVVAQDLWVRHFEGEGGDKGFWVPFLASACYGQLRRWKEATG